MHVTIVHKNKFEGMVGQNHELSIGNFVVSSYWLGRSYFRHRNIENLIDGEMILDGQKRMAQYDGDASMVSEDLRMDAGIVLAWRLLQSLEHDLPP